MEARIWCDWDEFIGLTFLAKDGGTYQLMPYEQISQAEYHKLRSHMKAFRPELVTQYEQMMFESIPEGDGCASGACPVR